MANSLAVWPPPCTHADERHTVENCERPCDTRRSREQRSGEDQDAQNDRERSGRRRRERRPHETGGERRTSAERSEIGAGSDTCFLTPCEERRGVCPKRKEERREEKRGWPSGACAVRAFNVAEGNMSARCPGLNIEGAGPTSAITGAKRQEIMCRGLFVTRGPVHVSSLLFRGAPLFVVGPSRTRER